jgi:hypothetical protein
VREGVTDSRTHIPFVTNGDFISDDELRISRSAASGATTNFQVASQSGSTQGNAGAYTYQTQDYVKVFVPEIALNPSKGRAVQPEVSISGSGFLPNHQLYLQNCDGSWGVFARSDGRGEIPLGAPKVTLSGCTPSNTIRVSDEFTTENRNEYNSASFTYEAYNPTISILDNKTEEHITGSLTATGSDFPPDISKSSVSASSSLMKLSPSSIAIGLDRSWAQNVTITSKSETAGFIAFRNAANPIFGTVQSHVIEFLPKPTIVLEYTSGAPGATLQVKGHSFIENSPLVWTVNGVKANLQSKAGADCEVATQDGQIPDGCTITLPQTGASGDYDIEVADQSNASKEYNIGEANYWAIKPFINIDPETGPSSTNLYIAGAGFEKNSPLFYKGCTIERWTHILDEKGKILSTNSSGGIPRDTTLSLIGCSTDAASPIEIATETLGTYYSHSENYQALVTSISLTPHSDEHIGGSISATGAGFNPGLGSETAITNSDPNIADLSASTVGTDESGSWKNPITVTAKAAGSTDIGYAGPPALSGPTFKVIPAPTISLPNDTGEGHLREYITGQNFLKASELTWGGDIGVKYNVTDGCMESNDSGELESCEIIFSSNDTGSVNISVWDSSNTPDIAGQPSPEKTAYASFWVIDPQIYPDKMEEHVGGVINFFGEGFTPNQASQILQTSNLNITPTQIATDQHGDWVNSAGQETPIQGTILQSQTPDSNAAYLTFQDRVKGAVTGKHVSIVPQPTMQLAGADANGVANVHPSQILTITRGDHFISESPLVWNRALDENANCPNSTVTGTFYNCRLTVPNSLGENLITVYDNSNTPDIDAAPSPLKTASAKFIVYKPTLQFTPIVGPKENTLRLQGAGFIPGNDIFWRGCTQTDFVDTGRQATADGAIPEGIDIHISGCSIGINAIQVSDAPAFNGENYATYSYRVYSPTITIDGSSVEHIGGYITFAGTNFTPTGAENGIGLYSTDDVTFSPSTITVGANTNWSSKVKGIGARAVSGSIAHITDASGIQAATPEFQFLGSPVINLSSYSGEANNVITVTGNTFLPLSDLTWSIDGAQIAAPAGCEASTNLGRLPESCMIRIPQKNAGFATVSVKDSSNTTISDNATGSAQFWVAKPSLALSPNSGPSSATIGVQGAGYDRNAEIWYKASTCNTPYWTQIQNVSTDNIGAIDKSKVKINLQNCAHGLNIIYISNSYVGKKAEGAIYLASGAPAAPESVTSTPSSSSKQSVNISIVPGSDSLPEKFEVQAINAFGAIISLSFTPAQGGENCIAGGICVYNNIDLRFDGNYTIKARSVVSTNSSPWTESDAPQLLPIVKEKTDNPPFTDISSQSADIKSSIIWAYQYGVTTGSDATHFSPKKSTNRGQMAAFLWRIAGQPKISSSLPDPFKDISTYGAKEPIKWLVSVGITTGYECSAKGKPAKQCTKKGDIVYQPSKTVNRAQMALFMYRLAGKPPTGGAKNPFVDINSQSADVKTAITWLVSQGITTGTDKTHYSPTKSVTRAQMAAFMKRFATAGKYVN